MSDAYSTSDAAASAVGHRPTVSRAWHSPSFTVSDAEDVTLTYDCVVTAASSDASLTVPAPVCGPTTTLDLSAAPDDDYTLTVTVTDQAGQTSVAGADTYTLDTSTPTPAVTLTVSSPGTDPSPTFSFTDGEGADTFSCEWQGPDGSDVSNGPCISGDPISTAGRGDGTYSLIVTATDAVGNTASAPAVTYELEAGVPPAPTVTVVGGAFGNSPTVSFNVSDSENVHLDSHLRAVGWGTAKADITACGAHDVRSGRRA